ncbi:MAG: hypothetical protein JXB50_13380 [Spirochaetes bacterium]|nr:hypothetical protein [Spirochaetota bacterium]
MKVLKKILLFFLYHQRDYTKILSLTAFDKENLENNKIITDIRYQAIASFYTKNYYHSQYCFEALNEKGLLKSSECNYLAFMYARHNEKEKAISTWCLALEKDKNNKSAKIALDYLRNQGREANLIEDDFFEMITPKEPFKIPYRLIIKGIIFFITSLIIISALYFGALKLNDYLKYRKQLQSAEINRVKLKDFNTNLLDKEKELKVKYSYNEREIKSKFENIKKNILKNKAVEAQIEINEILLSNASLNVKIKTEFLNSFILEPEYSTFKNLITFEKFNAEKKLYKDIYILWDGIIKNKIIKKDLISFDLFIGDELKGLVVGIVPVVFKKAHLYNNNDHVYVYGKIIEENDSYYIDGKYIIDSKQYDSYQKRN